jgi:hypothetical protein
MYHLKKWVKEKLKRYYNTFLAIKQDQWPEGCSFTYKTLIPNTFMHPSNQKKKKKSTKRKEFANYTLL